MASVRRAATEICACRSLSASRNYRLGARRIHAESSSRGAAGRRKTPVFRRAMATWRSRAAAAFVRPLDRFASLAMTAPLLSKRAMLQGGNPIGKVRDVSARSSRRLSSERRRPAEQDLEQAFRVVAVNDNGGENALLPGALDEAEDARLVALEPAPLAVERHPRVRQDWAVRLFELLVPENRSPCYARAMTRPIDNARAMRRGNPADVGATKYITSMSSNQAIRKKEKMPWGSAQPAEKARFGQGNPRQSKPFP
jgi:hypothetical protein